VLTKKKKTMKKEWQVVGEKEESESKFPVCLGKGRKGKKLYVHTEAMGPFSTMYVARRDN
jgi:hypothetical protein